MLIETDDYVTAADAAKMLGITTACMAVHCRNKRFKDTVKIGRSVLIPRAEVEGFERRKPGPKRKAERRGQQ